MYPEKEIGADQSSTMDGLRLVFPGADQACFEDEILDYDSISDGFSLTPNETC